MASVKKIGDHHWVVHMGDEPDSTELVEVRMSAESAERIVSDVQKTLAALNPDRDDLPGDTLGSAVLLKLSR